MSRISAVTPTAGFGFAILDFGFWIALLLRAIFLQSKIANRKSKIPVGLQQTVGKAFLTILGAIAAFASSALAVQGVAQGTEERRQVVRMSELLPSCGVA